MPINAISLTLAVMLLSACYTPISSFAVEPLFGLGRCSCESCEEEDECELSFGPCECQPRMTLFQWSYGTSFEGGAPGYDEPLVTDRPDFTEASVTVGRGVAQLEVGYTYSYDDEGTDFTRTHSWGEPLLRVGILAEWLELRLGWNYADQQTRSSGTVSSISGSEDLYFGFKIGLTPQECWLPEMALIPQMTFPTGDAEFTSGQTLPGVNWIYAWELTDRISTAGSSQINRALDSTTMRSYSEFAQSWTVAYSLTERIGGYTEWFALVPDGADTERTQHYFNGGFTFLWSNNLQFDIRAGVGLSDASDDYFLGSGFSQRF